MISNTSSGGASLTTVNIYQALELEPAQDTAQASVVVPDTRMLYKELRRHKNFASFPYLSTALGARPEMFLGLVVMNFPGIILKLQGVPRMSFLCFHFVFEKWKWKLIHWTPCIIQ